MLVMIIVAVIKSMNISAILLTVLLAMIIIKLMAIGILMIKEHQINNDN